MDILEKECRRNCGIVPAMARLNHRWVKALTAGTLLWQDKTPSNYPSLTITVACPLFLFKKWRKYYFITCIKEIPSLQKYVEEFSYFFNKKNFVPSPAGFFLEGNTRGAASPRPPF